MRLKSILCALSFLPLAAYSEVKIGARANSDFSALFQVSSDPNNYSCFITSVFASDAAGNNREIPIYNMGMPSQEISVPVQCSPSFNFQTKPDANIKKITVVYTYQENSYTTISGKFALSFVTSSKK